jgi:threonine/homoserine/homoserine lactone efflux protein
MRSMLGPLVVFALAMCLTPGPNVVMITASGANFGFRRAVPHAWVSVIGALAAFTSPQGDMLWQIALITSVLTAACLLSCAIWAGFGVAIGRYLGTARARTMFNRSMAGLLVLSLVPVFW